MAVLGLHCFAWPFSSCAKWGLLSSCDAWVSHCGGFSCCGAQALGMCRFQQLWLPGSRSQAQQLWDKDLVAPQHVESSWIRDQTHVTCRWIVYHLATKEVQAHFFWLEQRDHGKNLGRNFWMLFWGAQLLNDMKPLQI